MRLLLDAHAFVWAATRPDALSPTLIAALLDPQGEIFVSAISAYEIEYSAIAILSSRSCRPSLTKL